MVGIVDQRSRSDLKKPSPVQDNAFILFMVRRGGTLLLQPESQTVIH